jgi:cyanophycinase
MTGTVALVGGGEFSAACATIDAELLRRADPAEVLVLPTASAYEHPGRVLEAAVAHFAGLGVPARGLEVLRRPDALAAAHVDAVAGARFVYLAGGSPMHLRSVLKDTPLWEALCAVPFGGGVLAAAGEAAAAVCDPMTDPRGGAFTLGLGLVSGLAVMARAERWSLERSSRTHDLGGGVVLAELPAGAALLRGPGGWDALGDGIVVRVGRRIAGLDALP